MTGEPAISVCVPTANRREMVCRVVELVLASDFGDFELIVADHGSKDGTWEALSAIRDPRVKIVQHGGHQGMMRDWDRLVRRAAAPVIFRLDDDDYIDGKFLGGMADLFRRHPEVMSAYSGYAYTSAYDFSRYLEVVDQGVFRGRETAPGAELVRTYLLQNPFPGIHPASVVYRRSALEQVGYYREAYTDHSFALALAACGAVGYLHGAHFFYVQHRQLRVSTSWEGKILQHLRDFDPLDAAKRVYESPFRGLREMPGLAEIKEQVYRKHLRLYPCIQMFCARNNLRRRGLVARSGYYMARKYPQIALDPVVWAAFFAMFLLPMTWLTTLMGWYRKGRG